MVFSVIYGARTVRDLTWDSPHDPFYTAQRDWLIVGVVLSSGVNVLVMWGAVVESICPIIFYMLCHGLALPAFVYWASSGSPSYCYQLFLSLFILYISIR